MKKIFTIIIFNLILILNINAQNSCSGTINYSSLSTTAPYTRIGNGTSGAIRICLTANSLSGKCSGTNSSIVIYACSDATCSNTAGILAIWDVNTPVGTCLTTYLNTTTCNGYIRVRRFCGGGSASLSWTTVSGLTNTCTSSPIPTLTNGTDCSTPTPICTSGTFAGNASGAGNQELGCGSSSTTRGCLLNGENNSAWYTFKALTSGTVTFTIQPTTNKDDYDFAVWQGSTCPPNTAPLRCNYALNKGATGLNTTATVTSEDGGCVTGAGCTNTGFSSALNVVAGQTYTVLIDGFATAIDPNYTFTFGGTASLDCGILPVSLIDFKIFHIKDKVKIMFTTSNEVDNKYFIIEKSIDGVEFNSIDTLETIGNSNFNIDYESFDKKLVLGTSYYRIKQVDNSGKFTFSNMLSIKINDIINPILLYKHDILGRDINNFDIFTGMYIEIYDNGNIIKKIK